MIDAPPNVGSILPKSQTLITYQAIWRLPEGDVDYSKHWANNLAVEDFTCGER